MADISGRGLSLGGVNKLFITADALFCKSMRLLLNSVDLLVTFSKSTIESKLLHLCIICVQLLHLHIVIFSDFKFVYNCPHFWAKGV